MASSARCFRCALGALSAALLFEFALRPFVADSTRAGPPPVRIIRSYFEGVSVSHFEPDGLDPFGNRLTGNPPLPGAPEGLIVGDSHVVAFAVHDSDTMGAVVERLSRTNGHPLNVRQYGWPGADAPVFISAAAALLPARKPAWVAVVLNSYNVRANAVPRPSGAISELAPDGLFRNGALRQTKLARIVLVWARKSTLALALRRRFGLIQNRVAAEKASRQTPSPERGQNTGQQIAQAARGNIMGLKQAYGARLIIVYAPSDISESLEPGEAEVASFCAEQNIPFVSTRAAFLRDRREHSRWSRGFRNTAPGVGHFNAIGHRIIGEEIWGYLAARTR